MRNRKADSAENQTDDKIEGNHGKMDLKGDHGNIAILLLLYLLQGVPLGISGSVPILLQNRGISYVQQAGFTFAFYPENIMGAYGGFSLHQTIWTKKKLADSSANFSGALHEWMGDATKGPQIIWLASGFFVSNFLAATQDVAVDGWALTMLKRDNVGYAATCNAVGQTAGGFLGYVVFLVLESKEFSNKYVFSEPREEGLVTLGGYLRFWGMIFLGVTILIAIFKREKSDAESGLEENPDYGITKAYPVLWKILKLKPIIRLSLIFLTAKVSFAACDAITTLKLIEYGVPKDKVALLSIPLVPLEVLLPFFISRFTSGPRPMAFYIKMYPYRLIVSVVIVMFAYWTPAMIINDGKTITIPIYFYVAIVSIYIVYQIPLRGMFVTHMAFINLGGMWLKTFCLWLVDFITWKSCVFDGAALGNSTFSLTDNTCANKEEQSECLSNGGTCRTDIDGYYVQVALNVIYGVIWIQWAKRVIKYLEDVPRHEWHVLSKRPPNEDETPLNEIVSVEKK
ncbi:Acetyl-coenzyme A transporter 1 [Pseudolycoriella hygida]|uniref:Acetyl-coenzyme A transporter 1 n=1 Tax=Pseudolycoriella hygida TaxID=35572 RepID=A0A9Q0S9K4_9DIPT|nr:Acetyl-coenzyme A transporter 1 [Pseudolycoriella hygida]